MKEICYYLGLDLGQAADFTALAVLECPIFRDLNKPDPVYSVRHLDRFPLGTPYPEIVRSVVGMLKTNTLQGATLVVDQTGVGRAVVDLFRETMRGQVTCTFAPINISSGHKAHVVDGGIIVPKKELVSTLQVLLQSRRLRIASSLSYAEVLVRELENFSVKITPVGNETFAAWREGIHDDLVLAVGLAAWVAERVVAERRQAMRETKPRRPQRIIA